MRLVGQIIGGLFLNALLVIAMAGLGMFVWNTGVVGLIPNLSKISFPVASAIMTGIMLLNMFAKSWYRRISFTRQERKLIDELLGKKK